MADPLVTVIIPNYNGMAYLPPLLTSLDAQSDPRLKITVVDDASTDQSVKYLREHWPKVRLICNEKNVGFAGSCNAGLGEATTPFVALLNNDTRVEADWLAEGLRPFDDDRVGSVASLVLLAEPPHLIDTAGDLYSVAGGGLKRLHRRPRDCIDGLESVCFSPSGVSAFYRREALLEVGFLDERFESYYEDIDLGFRLAWAGYHCVFAPRSVCYHHLSVSYRPTGRRYHFNSARNAEILWWSLLPARLRRRYLFSHLCFLMLQGMNKLRQGCFRPYLAGKWAAGSHRRHILEKRQALQSFARLSCKEIESLLVRNWWKLHVSSRRGQVASKALSL